MKIEKILIVLIWILYAATYSEAQCTLTGVNNRATNFGCTYDVTTSIVNHGTLDAGTILSGDFSAVKYSSIIDSTVISTRSYMKNFTYSRSQSDGRYLQSLSGKTTSDLAEGSNLYYTATRFNNAFSGKSTTDLSEGTNQYFTNTRARGAISLTTTGSSGAAAYNSSTGILNIPQYSFTNQSITISGDGAGTGTTAIALTLATVNSNVGTFNGPYTVNAKGLVTAALNRSFNATPGRLLSTTGSDNTFTISSTRDVHVSYTINFSANITLTTSNGAVSLDYSTNGGSSWITVCSVSQVFGTSITINTSQDQVLAGMIPANALVRINRTSNANVTVTLSTSKQQEITL